jgi:xanthine/CO dehydrogenase XdhC/CoxF family maturation factor
MSSSLQRLLPLFERESARHLPLVLATLVRTDGSTYTKPGAHMLIAGHGEYAGLLSGGCLEGDLAEHGRAVLATGVAKLARYNTQGPEDLLFGLGSGCEGTMDILLQRLDGSNDWQPLKRLALAWRAQRAQTLVLVVQSTLPNVPAGAGVFAGDHQVFGLSTAAALDPRTLESLCRLAAALPHQGHNQFLPQALPGIDLLALKQLPPTRLLLLLSETVDAPAPEPQPAHFPAAIVMSHHLATDRASLRALASSGIPYVGLLGPATRRERLLVDLGDDAAALRPRLRAPVGLDLGAVTPEAIALSIIAEIQAALAGRTRTEPLAQVHA